MLFVSAAGPSLGWAGTGERLCLRLAGTTDGNNFVLSWLQVATVLFEGTLAEDLHQVGDLAGLGSQLGSLLFVVL